MNTITLPNELQARAEAAARERGTTVDELAVTLFEAYLEDLDDARAVDEARAAVARGEDELFDWETVKREEGW